MRTIQQTEEGPHRSPGNLVEVPEGVKSWRVSTTYALPVVVALVMLSVEVIAIYSAFLPG